VCVTEKDCKFVVLLKPLCVKLHCFVSEIFAFC
jgi:hypothetical protein